MKIFITGGTSGIGTALVQKYLKAGHEVGICSRNAQNIYSTIDNHPNLKAYSLDVYDKTALAEAVSDFSNGELDIMIIAAGNYTESIHHKTTYEESTTMLKVNIIGALNAFEVAREIMGKRKKGQIVAIASVAGLLDYPQASIYAKTRRTLIQLCDTYRRTLSDFGITVTTIVPGYIDTPRLRELNDNDLSKKPFVISCEYAVGTIIKAIEQKKEMVIFPVKMKYLIRFLSILPKGLLSFIMKKR